MTAKGLKVPDRIDQTLQFSEQLINANPIYLQNNPQIINILKGLKNQNRNYLAHEYFNHDWHPILFTKISELLQTAKLSFAAPARYNELFDNLILTNDHQNLLKSITNTEFRETVKDFCMSQRFRADYWIKGGIKLSAAQRIKALRNERVVLAKSLPNISLKVNHITLDNRIYDPILAILADYQIHYIGEIADQVNAQNISFSQMIEGLMILIGIGAIHNAQSDSIIQQARFQTQKLNHFIIEQAKMNQDLKYLASPVSGGGFIVSQISQIFLSAYWQKLNQPQELAKFTWDIFKPQGWRLAKASGGGI